MPKIFAVAFLGLVIVWGAGELNAQDKWSHEVTPAFWVAGGDGEISFLSEDGPVKLVFDDMWRMEPGLALTIQGNRTRLGYILDVSYGRTAIGDYDWSLMFLNAGGTYRLSNGDTGVNLVFGVRHASTSGGLRVPTGEDPDEEGDDDAFKKLRGERRLGRRVRRAPGQAPVRLTLGVRRLLRRRRRDEQPDVPDRGGIQLRAFLPRERKGGISAHLGRPRRLDGRREHHVRRVLRRSGIPFLSGVA
jgi:hypothetical protein